MSKTPPYVMDLDDFELELRFGFVCPECRVPFVKPVGLADVSSWSVLITGYRSEGRFAGDWRHPQGKQWCDTCGAEFVRIPEVTDGVVEVK